MGWADHRSPVAARRHPSQRPWRERRCNADNSRGTYTPVNYIQALVEKGADIDAVRDEADTALIVAAPLDDLPSVEYLCDQGADFMHLNKAGENAITVSIAKDNDDCTIYLNGRMLEVLRGLKSAADAGNTFAQNLIRNPGGSKAQNMDGMHNPHEADTQRDFSTLDGDELEFEVSRLRTQLDEAVEKLHAIRGQRVTPMDKVAVDAKKLHNLFSSMHLGGRQQRRRAGAAASFRGKDDEDDEDDEDNQDVHGSEGQGGEASESDVRDNSEATSPARESRESYERETQGFGANEYDAHASDALSMLRDLRPVLVLG
jgi:hypothetical protein